MVKHGKDLVTRRHIPDFKEGNKGRLIAGIHASIVQLKNGDIMALGRGNTINGEMPMSISNDMGKSWTYRASGFPPISGGQRLVLKRLNEGPLLLISFTNHEPENKKVMMLKRENNEFFEGFGLFAALSFDDGKTWPVNKLLTTGQKQYLYGGWTGFFKMDETHAEPKGYLAITQSPDNVIHLLSSALYYRFNLNWLLTL